MFGKQDAVEIVSVGNGIRLYLLGILWRWPLGPPYAAEMPPRKWYKPAVRIGTSSCEEAWVPGRRIANTYVNHDVF